MSQSNRETRRAVAALGYDPLVLFGKKPPIDAWTSIISVTRAMLDDWERAFPGASNTGILTRHTPTLDLDLLHEPAAVAAEALVRERYGDRGRIIVRIGRAPKRAIPFRTGTPFKKITTKFVVAPGAEAEQLEFLAKGQQVAILGTHPDTQREYQWNGGDPSTVAHDELPEISEAEAQELQSEIAAMLVRDFGYTIATPSRGNGHGKGGHSKAAPKSTARDTIWARTALDQECAAVARAQPGDRNAQLNLSAYNVFQIVWGDPHLLNAEEVFERLFQAAKACGLVDDDGDEAVWKTLRSAAEGARLQPRVRPVPLLTGPAPNGPGGSGLGAGGAGGGAGFGAGFGAGAAAPTPGPMIGIRPVIQLVRGERHRNVDEAEAALIAAGGFDLYQRDAIMVRPVMQRLPAAGWHDTKRTTVAWRLMRVKALYLVEMLGRAARFQEWSVRSRDWVDKDCPQVIGETLLARDGAWKLPVLLGIVHVPQLRADGSLLDAPGYDPETRLLYRPDGEVFPAIPDAPTEDDARRALEVIRQAIGTFPFVGEIDRSVALSLLLTGVCRRTLDLAPMHAITARAAGSGKSLLVDLVSILLTGQPAPVISAEIDDAEFEKRLGACLMAGDPIISLDNCVKPLDHALLCQALSQSRLGLRVLGFSENRDLTMSALLTATGNNLVLSGDLPRRSLRCKLDAGVERPELRVFPGPRIQSEFRRRRGELVAALLTILRARQVSGPVKGATPLGGFEMWSHWVRDALLWLGCADPCETIEEIRASDPEHERHAAVVLAWRDCFGLGTEITVREVIEKADPNKFVLHQPTSNQRLHDAMLAVAEDLRHRGVISNARLGHWLRKVDGRFERDMRIVRTRVLDGYPRFVLQT